MTINEQTNNDVISSSEVNQLDVLRKENETLQNRITNLNAFRELFFTLQEELIAEKENTQKLQQHITELETGNKIETDSTETPGHQTLETPPAAIKAPQQTTNEEDFKHAQELILHSLAVFNEQDALVNALQNIYASSNYKNIIQATFELLHCYHLSGALQIRSNFGQLNESTNPDKIDDYLGLINRFKLSGASHTHESNIIFNKHRVSLLIDNIPNDATTTHRLALYIDNIVAACNIKIAALDNERNLRVQHKKLKSIVEATYASISQIQKSTNEQSEQIQKLFNTMGKDLAKHLSKTTISDEEKKVILGFLAAKREEITDLPSLFMQLDDKFVNVINQLKNTYQKTT